jgi:hypothetical protein
VPGWRGVNSASFGGSPLINNTAHPTLHVANAAVYGGSGDYAFADGTDSSAIIGQYGASDLSSAIANGTDSSAQVSLGNFDFASASGDKSLAGAGYGNFDIATAKWHRQWRPGQRRCL